METVFKQYFARDLGRIISDSKPFRKLNELYSDKSLPSIDFEFGESRMEEIFGEAMGMAFEYRGVPVHK